MLNLDENCLNIFTDGSQKNKPSRLGGCAYRFVLVDDVTGNEIPIDFKSGCFKGATNNQMELMAVIRAIKEILKNNSLSRYLQRSRKIVFYTDSLYIQKFYQVAMYDWSTSEWTNFDGKVIKNIKLWKELNKLRRKVARETGKYIYFEWVKAHQTGKKKNIHNEAVDILAGDAALGDTLETSDLFVIPDVRKKGTNEKTVLGTVIMSSQISQIYVVTDEPLKKHYYRYKYRIIDVESPYFNRVDVADSKICLRAGHYYQVVFNEDQKNPMIVEAEETEKGNYDSSPLSKA